LLDGKKISQSTPKKPKNGVFLGFFNGKISKKFKDTTELCEIIYISFQKVAKNTECVQI
jgi:hypothetical protein